MFRGANVFNQSGQSDQNMMLAPSVTWSLGDSGLSLGYWGAFQINGANVQDNLADGLGAEQDLIIGYEYSLPYDLSLSAALTYYFLPLADPSTVGTSTPGYLEPALGLSYSGIVDTGLNAAYFWGIQDLPNIRGISYLYISPFVEKTLALHEHVGLNMALSYGYKQYLLGNQDASNIHDVTACIALPLSLLPNAVITPSMNLAWTDVADPSLANGLIYWGGLNFAVSL